MNLYKSNDKWLFGVIAGLSECFGISTTLMRLLFVLFMFSCPVLIFIYIVLAILIPPKPSNVKDPL